MWAGSSRRCAGESFSILHFHYRADLLLAAASRAGARAVACPISPSKALVNTKERALIKHVNFFSLTWGLPKYLRGNMKYTFVVLRPGWNWYWPRSGRLRVIAIPFTCWCMQAVCLHVLQSTFAIHEKPSAGGETTLAVRPSRARRCRKTINLLIFNTMFTMYRHSSFGPPLYHPF